MSARLILGTFPKEHEKVLTLGPKPGIQCFKYLADDRVAVPFTYAVKLGLDIAIKSMPPIVQRLPAGFQLLPHQGPIIDEIVKRLRETRVAVLSAPTGAGKTNMALVVSLMIPGRKLILCPNSSLVPQWITELKKLAPNAIIYAEGPGLPKPCVAIECAEYIIVYHQRALKMDASIVEDVNCLITDEIHNWCNNTGVNVLLHIRARYMIACTATPEQRAAYVIVEAFFGENPIMVHLDQPFNFILFDMGVFVDDAMYAKARGNANMTKYQYGRMERAIVHDEECLTRWLLLLEYVVNVKGRKVLGITKYVSQARKLSERLGAMGITSSTFVEDERTFDGNASVLIGTIAKVSTGFDQGSSGVAFDKRFDTVLIMQSINVSKASDRFTQMIGRVLRAKGIQPVVVWPLYRGLRTDTFVKHANSATEFVQNRGSATVINMHIIGIAPHAMNHKLVPDEVLARVANSEADADTTNDDCRDSQSS